MRGGAPGTGISRAQIIGTSPHPSSRAARAGKSAVRSGVRVKIAETMRDGDSPFARESPAQSARTAAWIASAESRSTWTAPRMANMKSVRGRGTQSVRRLSGAVTAEMGSISVQEEISSLC